MTIDVFNTKGEKTGKMRLPKEIFGVEASPQLLAQAVRVYFTNQKKARPKTKTRGEIVGSTKKIWRQKGTGRARHGDRYAPIFVGGGVAHGPKGILRRLSMPKKMKKKALFGSLSDKVREKKLLVVEGLVKVKPKTKQVFQVVGHLKFKNDKIKKEVKAESGKKKVKKEKTKTLLVLKTDQKSIIRGARNIANVNIAYFNQLNCYQVLDSGLIIFSKEALEDFNKLNK